MVSGSTALSCLALLRFQNGISAAGAFDLGNNLEGDGLLPISVFVRLADAFGFRAQYIFRDWQWLKLEIASSPVLLLLKNRNTVVAIGSRCSNVEEILVSDPLYRDGKVFTLPREDLERAWDGDVLTIVPWCREDEKSSTRFFSGRPRLYENSPSIIAEQQSAAMSQLLSTGSKGRWERTSLYLVVALVATVSLVVVGSESNFGANSNHTPTALRPILQHSLQTGAATRQDYNVSTTAVAWLPTVPMPEAVQPDPEAPRAEQAAATVGAEPSDTPPNVALLRAASPPPRLPVTPIAPASVAAPPAPSSEPLQPKITENDEGSWLGLSTEDISALLARGDDYFRTVDVVTARLFYERAADAGSAEAALRLGETFDPDFLARISLRGITGDIAEATYWYCRARDLGSAEAQILLEHR